MTPRATFRAVRSLLGRRFVVRRGLLRGARGDLVRLAFNAHGAVYTLLLDSGSVQPFKGCDLGRGRA